MARPLSSSSIDVVAPIGPTTLIVREAASHLALRFEPAVVVEVSTAVMAYGSVPVALVTDRVVVVVVAIPPGVVVVTVLG